MNTKIRTLATENYIESKYNLKYFDQDILDLTGSIRVAQVYAAIRFDFKNHIWAHHKEEVIANDHWFYIRRDYLANFCKVSPNLISKCVKVLVKHGLLETKVISQGYRKGTTTYYRFSTIVLEAGGNSLTTANWSKNAGELYSPAKNAGELYSPAKNAGELYSPAKNAGELYSPAKNTTDVNRHSEDSPKNAGELYSPACTPDDLTGNPDDSSMDECSSRARNIYNNNNKNNKNKNTYGCASASHCVSSPKNPKLGVGELPVTIPNYSKLDWKCAKFVFEQICENFPKSNASKIGWESLQHEWSVTISKLAKKFTEGDRDRVRAALQWAFGPRNRKNSFLQENIRSLPMLLTKKWNAGGDKEFTFDRLLRDFDNTSTESSIEDDIDTQLRIECKKVLADYEDPKCTVDDIMTWIEYLQQEIDDMNDMLPPDKRSMWHRRNSMAKVVKWITDIVEYFVGCSRYPDADSYVETFIERTKDKIRAGKLRFLWPGYFSENADDYSAFERAAVDNYPGIFG